MSTLLIDDDKSYELSPPQRAVVSMLAKASHEPCNGTGIVSWEAGGKVANLCTCVVKNGTSLEQRLEELQEELKAKIAAAKAGTLT